MAAWGRPLGVWYSAADSALAWFLLDHRLEHRGNKWRVILGNLLSTQQVSLYFLENQIQMTTFLEA